MNTSVASVQGLYGSMSENLNVEKIAEEALAENLRYRAGAFKGGLYELPVKVVPPGSASDSFARRGMDGANVAAHKFAFHSKSKPDRWPAEVSFPPLVDLILEDERLCLAGGAVTAHLDGQKTVEDYDFFSLHESDADLLETIVRVARHYNEIYSDATIFRTAYCVTLSSKGPTAPVVQIVLRRYSSIEEVLQWFDLGSCMFALHRGRVWATGLGLVAFRFFLNVANPAARRATFERRLKKYFDRGYHIYLPRLAGPRTQYLQNIILCKTLEFSRRKGEDHYSRVYFTHPNAPTGEDRPSASDEDLKAYEGSILEENFSNIYANKNYYDRFVLEQLVANNFGYLCARCPARLVADGSVGIAEMRPEPPAAEVLAPAVQNVLTKSPKKYIQLMGEKYASERLVANVLAGSTPAADVEARAAELAEIAAERMPPCVVGCAPLPPIGMSDEAWYGEHYEPAAAQP